MYTQITHVVYTCTWWELALIIYDTHVHVIWWELFGVDFMAFIIYMYDVHCTLYMYYYTCIHM